MLLPGPESAEPRLVQSRSVSGPPGHWLGASTRDS